MQTKWVVITGAAKGLGAAIALELASEGHDVIIHYNTNEKLAEQQCHLCREKGVLAEKIQCDFASLHALERFKEEYLGRFPKTKGLINNVGNYPMKPLLSTTSSQMLEVFQTNFFAAWEITSFLLPEIISNKGRIINIGSVGTRNVKPSLVAPAYMASKTALYSLTVSLAKELASSGVTVNMISPGYLENTIDLDDASGLPMKRKGKLQEVASLVSFLFKEQSSYTTGQNIEIAGGVAL